jgi:hypothetical protein
MYGTYIIGNLSANDLFDTFTDSDDKVIYSNDGSDFPGKDAFIKGWIYKSRVCFDSGWYGWRKRDPQVCK